MKTALIMMWLIAMTITLCLLLSCSTVKQTQGQQQNKSILVRIAQVDKDGKTIISPVKKN